jgi:hypothetical protein
LPSIRADQRPGIRQSQVGSAYGHELLKSQVSGRINPLLSKKKITEKVSDNGSRFWMSDAVREIKK